MASSGRPAATVAARALANLANCRRADVRRAVGDGALPALAAALRCKDLVFEACVAVTCLVCFSPEATAAERSDAQQRARTLAATPGAVPALVRMLSPDWSDGKAAHLAMLAAEALYGLASCGDASVGRAVAEAGASEPLRALKVQRNDPRAAGSAARALEALAPFRSSSDSRGGAKEARSSGKQRTAAGSSVAAAATATRGTASGAVQPAAAAAPQDARCAACGALSRDVAGGWATLKSCSACHTVRYCGEPCQKLNWGMHKAACKAARK